ncbi:Outer membrane receptor proteins, mostly Fe transport [Chishuiella changwenlii]|uniref:Outer membrane receptor proteins, mostly Fe transport n=1 Tax=Chishuiella changwenlii TaxID=1434701 RepID=A0A1M6SW66_9FLAO|nr:TonB-dependent receptor [Chishuiella changwenlii]GGF09090.1 TonB-dependent receptor [Chishuiella changwenlii]SHK48907.1 Outer membrane receptor proteins, mostly Fe transport [Chishuiella changwenlii]
MLKKSVFTFFFFLTVIVNAQHSVSGVIHDENNQLLKNLDVELILTNSSKKTKTNKNGEYQFSDIGNGEYQLKIYKEEKEEVYFIKVEDKDLIYNTAFNLSSHIGLNEVNIKKLRSVKSELEKKGFAVNVIETKEASVRNTQTLELLDQSVGVRIRQNGGLGSEYQFNINGMSGNSIRIFIDGIPMASYGSAFNLNNIPTSMIERVEVFKGVVPGYLANDALGGAVNIVLKESAKNSLNASISYGSFNTTQANFSGNYRAKSGFTINTSMYYNYSDNDYKVWGRSIFETLPNGVINPIKARRFNDKFYSYGSATEIGVTKKKWADRFMVGYNNAYEYKEIQHGQFMVRPYKDRFRTRNTNVASVTYKKNNLFTRGLDLNIKSIYSNDKQVTSDTNLFAYGWNGQQILDRFGNPVRSAYGAQQGAASIRHINRDFINTNSSLSYRLNKNHSFSFNHLFTYQERKDNDELLSVVENKYRESSNFTKNNFALSYELSAFEDKLKTSLFGKHYGQNIERTRPVARVVDGQTVSVNQYDNSNISEGGYGFAASYLVANSVMLMGSAEKAIRMPSENEIFGDVSENKLDNFYLKPEKSNNYNLGLKLGPYKIGNHKADVSVNGFIRDTKDRIANFNYSNTNLGLSEAYASSNLAQTMVRGIDFEFNYSYSDKFKLLFNLSKFKSYMNDKSNTYYKDQLPNEPTFTMNTNAQYTFKNLIGKGSNFIVYYNYRFIDEFNSFMFGKLDGTNYFNVAQQNIQDAGITYQFPNKHFIVSFDAKNMFDKQAFDNFGVQKPGRAFFIKLNYSL